MRNIREVIKMCLEAEGVRDLPKKELVAVQRIQLTR
jgi:predicted RNase H-like HicB family nuclease